MSFFFSLKNLTLLSPGKKRKQRLKDMEDSTALNYARVEPSSLAESHLHPVSPCREPLSSSPHVSLQDCDITPQHPLFLSPAPSSYPVPVIPTSGLAMLSWITLPNGSVYACFQPSASSNCLAQPPLDHHSYTFESTSPFAQGYATMAGR